nr:MAG TPA: hypothetical protein [Caudoviricetes sp.]
MRRNNPTEIVPGICTYNLLFTGFRVIYVVPKN